MSSDNVTLVSLSAYEQDCLLLRSNVLARKSPWFKAVFKPVWDDQQGIKILELEFDVEEPLGFLIGKTKRTPRLERTKARNTVWHAVPKHDPSTGDPDLDTDMRRLSQDINRLSRTIGPRQFGEATAIAVHKLGFSILLDPYGAMKTEHLPAPSELKAQRGFKTYMLLQLLSWMDMYGDMVNDPETIACIDALVSGAHREELRRYGWIYLRIDEELKEYSLYKEALSRGVNPLSRGVKENHSDRSVQDGRALEVLDTLYSFYLRHSLTFEKYGGNEILLLILLPLLYLMWRDDVGHLADLGKRD